VSQESLAFTVVVVTTVVLTLVNIVGLREWSSDRIMVKKSVLCVCVCVL